MGSLTDNYIINKELGRGGMGAVFLATDKRLGRQVAIKMLQIQQSLKIEEMSEIITRFQKEAKAIASLAHPNIVGIHDIGEENNQHYMVMEFLEGKSIGNMLEEDKMLPIEQSLEISMQICKALTYIHSNSIVHRDIKPDNIIITKDGIAKLTDFGIAQMESDQLRLTQDGAILGSVMYISPEQLRNSKEVDNRADIYSYGVSLYQMLTGILPFAGETVGEVVAKILGEQATLPRQLNPDIPFELEAIVMKAMNKDKEKRYKSMEDMERDIKNLMATRSFKKTAVSVSSAATGENTGSLDRTLIIGKGEISGTGNSRGNTVYAGKGGTTPLKNIKPVIEKASSTTKILRTAGKAGISLAVAYASFSLFSGLLTPGAAVKINSAPDFAGSLIQGPYTQSLVESSVNIQAAFISLGFSLATLIFMAFAFPVDSKGIHRNFNLKSEVLPALTAILLTAAYLFTGPVKSDTMNEYVTAYNKDSVSETSDFEGLLKQKGEVFYSSVDQFKRKYKKLLVHEDLKFKYDEAPLQIRKAVLEGDHVKPAYLPARDEAGQRMRALIAEVFDVFLFPEPEKFLYVSKVGEIASVVSNGLITSIPEDAKHEVKNNGTKVENITFEWEKHVLKISANAVLLESGGERYVYPQKSEKEISFKFENLSDKPVLLMLYSTTENKLEKNITVSSGKTEEIQVTEGKEFEVVVLHREKHALPAADTLYFKNGDKISVDRIYYENPDYYTLTEKVYTNGETQPLTKYELLDEGKFVTRDADLTVHKLVKPKV